MTDPDRSLRDIAQLASDRNGGVKGRALDRIAKQHELTLSYTTFDRILAGTYNSTPSAKTLEALAVLAKVPLEEVYAAADLPAPLAKFADQLPPDSDIMTGSQREVIVALIRQFIAANRQIFAHSRLEHSLVLTNASGWDRTLELIGDEDDYDDLRMPSEPAADDTSIQAQADRIHRVHAGNFGAMLRYLESRKERGASDDPAVELEIRRRARSARTEFSEWSEVARDSASQIAVIDAQTREDMAEAQELLDHWGGDSDVVRQEVRNAIANGDMDPDDLLRIETALVKIEQLAQERQSRGSAGA